MIFGASTLNLYILNLVIGSISVVLIFLLAYIIFRDEWIGLIAAFIFAINRLYIIYNGCGEVETFFIFTLLAALIIFFITIRSKSINNYVLLFLLASLVGNIRKEGLPILLLMFSVGVLLFVPPKSWKSTLKHFSFASPLLMIFGISLVWWTLNFGEMFYGGLPRPLFSLDNLFSNSSRFATMTWSFLSQLGVFLSLAFAGIL